MSTIQSLAEEIAALRRTIKHLRVQSNLTDLGRRALDRAIVRLPRAERELRSAGGTEYDIFLAGIAAREEKATKGECARRRYGKWVE